MHPEKENKILYKKNALWNKTLLKRAGKKQTLSEAQLQYDKSLTEMDQTTTLEVNKIQDGEQFYWGKKFFWIKVEN